MVVLNREIWNEVTTGTFREAGIGWVVCWCRCTSSLETPCIYCMQLNKRQAGSLDRCLGVEQSQAAVISTDWQHLELDGGRPCMPFGLRHWALDGAQAIHTGVLSFLTTIKSNFIKCVIPSLYLLYHRKVKLNGLPRTITFLCKLSCFKVLFFFFIQRQSLVMYLSLAWNILLLTLTLNVRSRCHSSQTAGITGVYQHSPPE